MPTTPAESNRPLSAAQDVLRQKAWRLHLVSRLNVKYWQRMVSRSQARSSWVPLLVAVIGIVGSVIAKLCHYSWIDAAIPGVVGLIATVITRATSDRMASRLTRYFERWSELGHDAHDLWQEGERLRWGGTQVAKTVERLSERERNYHSQEYDAPNARILEECQRELWAEIGQAYD